MERVPLWCKTGCSASIRPSPSMVSRKASSAALILSVSSSLPVYLDRVVLLFISQCASRARSLLLARHISTSTSSQLVDNYKPKRKSSPKCNRPGFHNTNANTAGQDTEPGQDIEPGQDKEHGQHTERGKRVLSFVVGSTTYIREEVEVVSALDFLIAISQPVKKGEEGRVPS